MGVALEDDLEATVGAGCHVLTGSGRYQCLLFYRSFTALLASNGFPSLISKLNSCLPPIKPFTFWGQDIWKITLRYMGICSTSKIFQRGHSMCPTNIWGTFGGNKKEGLLYDCTQAWELPAGWRLHGSFFTDFRRFWNLNYSPSRRLYYLEASFSPLLNIIITVL